MTDYSYHPEREAFWNTLDDFERDVLTQYQRGTITADEATDILVRYYSGPASRPVGQTQRTRDELDRVRGVGRLYGLPFPAGMGADGEDEDEDVPFTGGRLGDDNDESEDE